MILTIFSITTLLLGNRQAVNPIVHGFKEGCEGKHQPCWYGIVPSETAYADIPSLLQTNNSSLQLDSRGNNIIATSPNEPLSCEVTFEGNRLAFYNCADIKVGDLAVFIRLPGSLFLWSCPDSLSLTYPAITFNVEDTSIIPPTYNSTVSNFAVYMPQDTSPQPIPNELMKDFWKSKPIRWRYMKLLSFNEGCPEG